MTHEQALALIKAADALPQEIGAVDTFRDGQPHCAIGHIMAPLLSQRYWITYAAYEGFSEVFGLAADDRVRVWLANDDAPAQRRRPEVIKAIEAICRNLGHDPDALRAEIAAEAHADG